MTLPDNPNWWMTALFFLAVAISGFVMKLVVLLQPKLDSAPHFDRFWLLLAPTSHRRLRPMRPLRTLVMPICLHMGILVVGCIVFKYVVNHFDLPLVIQSYLSAPLLFLMTDLLLQFFSILWMPSGKLLPFIHRRPWLAHNIADFWGRRWNLWFSDWFRYAIFQRMRRRPWLAMLIAFGVSGIIHEWVINVPLYAVFEVNQFGSMMVYFLLQPLGIFLERAIKLPPIGSYALTWGFVLGPCPLVINEGLLRVMHLYVN